jgi:hypothetical protein
VKVFGLSVLGAIAGSHLLPPTAKQSAWLTGDGSQVPDQPISHYSRHWSFDGMQQIICTCVATSAMKQCCSFGAM